MSYLRRSASGPRQPTDDDVNRGWHTHLSDGAPLIPRSVIEGNPEDRQQHQWLQSRTTAVADGAAYANITPYVGVKPDTCRHANSAELASTGLKNHNYTGNAAYHGLHYPACYPSLSARVAGLPEVRRRQPRRD